ncbi:EamA family transporter [Nitratireductor sp. CAU 1489]|uniref:EamA family transporter n=1 Tax=Nitratireductor arenosus TaxID=2682096 RepID=A0A844QER1_9HYPH|nr:DMT family transporter [Nitratireductor arenosus]MVA98456.1 EamA family transporter [Nitratireductor arenosus]
MTTAIDFSQDRTRLDMGALIAVGVTIIGWASAFPAIRAGLQGFGPAELGALRFAIAAVPAALYLLIMRPPAPARGEGWRFAYGGIVFVGLYTLFLNVGEMTVSAGAASFIINVSPIITAAFAVFVLGERFPIVAWIGTAVSFAGIGLIAFGEGEGLRLDTGALLILGAAFAAATTTIVQKPLFSTHRPLTVAAWNMVIGALVLAPFLPNAIGQAGDATTQSLAAAVYLGLVPSLVAYASWAVALSRLPAARASNYLYTVPAVATVMGYVWLGELPSAAGMAGGLLALGGVVLVNLSRR